MRPTVLLFQTNPQKTLSVRILAQKLGLRVLAAAPAQLGSPARGHPRADAGGRGAASRSRARCS